ncbi:23S rRNA (adenine(2503)-C(2))-methyltransferase RlmN [Halorhodospira halochloris]|uniref:Dual-specificity RNA methyltransferase RlmN n=1 Tax=Halorhodospira halochloris TaxID=1052 RepID=A0A120MZT6_HALHR|nr:23S rRNA (adenine(2503)-C(2))-methyltransferase RlmN [Halorhodospira halochloris]MBK1652329.1 23S rRNA (adenine(2503)-C(2))-methyltransferase RlmN [Halorhodospira halochloris]MCG5530097.1 23S rRNA (adenine(2503)-C(2))-methyltransferase RlmN [Halorhodospira halochloris]MCG5548442.1 23S rRNA (adenine(2503)-C(2))-methyltransferase RlmN [Halorhodospira halochloris]BAU57733.1 ribosomal RNA large subunit methyltransferase N [Halorhodospira halochloris]
MKSAHAEHDQLHAAKDAGPVELLGLDRPRLAAFFEALGEKRFRARQMMQWLHQRRVYDFEAMTDLSKALRAKLAKQAIVALPQIASESISADGTRKWVVRLADGHSVEMVYIPEPKRGTLCVSSQVGCPMGCRFCATGDGGFARNLSAAEIVGQLHLATEKLGDGAITNVVFMGMGEPLLNFDPVISASRVFTDDFGFVISKRRVTISTSGIVRAIKRLRGLTEVSLAVSLHAPNNELRNKIVPLNRKHPLEKLLPACHEYISDKPHRRITWEYVVLAGVNDADEHARELAARLRDIPSKINLIPFNPYPGARFSRPSMNRVNRFADLLLERNLTATIRDSRGDDIQGACGQLVGEVRDAQPSKLVAYQ